MSVDAVLDYLLEVESRIIGLSVVSGKDLAHKEVSFGVLGLSLDDSLEVNKSKFVVTVVEMGKASFHETLEDALVRRKLDGLRVSSDCFFRFVQSLEAITHAELANWGVGHQMRVLLEVREGLLAALILQQIGLAPGQVGVRIVGVVLDTLGEAVYSFPHFSRPLVSDTEK